MSQKDCLQGIKEEPLETDTNDGATLYLFKSEIIVARPGYPPRTLFKHQDPGPLKMMHQEMRELFLKDLKRFWGIYFF